MAKSKQIKMGWDVNLSGLGAIQQSLSPGVATGVSVTLASQPPQLQCPIRNRQCFTQLPLVQVEIASP